jgi:prolyl 4-hydroxylase
LIEVPLENCEGMQLVHYKPGQYYKPHHDYFQPNSSYWDREINRGGQRTWTAFLYLNDVKEGGTTNFPYIDIEVKPKAGRMVLWMNMINGKPNVDSYHEARAPKGCEKWGANIWVREKKFI